MSLQFLLDGYNIITRIRGLSQETLEDQRKFLVRLVAVNRPQGSVKNTVTIVFDGKCGIIGTSDAAHVKVIFSRGQSADDTIKKIVGQAAHKKNIIVVTDDRDIQYAVRAMGAKIMSAQEFLTKSKTAGQSRLSSPTAVHGREAGKNIPRTVEFKITSEFEKIWLRDKP